MFPIFDPFLAMARRGLAWVPGDGQAPTNPVHPVDVADACLDVLGRADDCSLRTVARKPLSRQAIVELHCARWARNRASCICRDGYSSPVRHSCGWSTRG